MTTVTVSPRFEVVIPHFIRNALGIRPGQRVHALQHRDSIELIPLRPMCKDRRSPKGIDTSVREAMAVQSADDRSYVPRTELGRRLLDLRNKSIRSGIKLLTISDINEEVTRRRGESCEC